MEKEILNYGNELMEKNIEELRMMAKMMFGVKNTENMSKKDLVVAIVNGMQKTFNNKEVKTKFVG